MLESIFTPPVITLTVLAITCFFFVSGKIRADVVALSGMLLLLIFGILNPAEALSGFSNSVVIMMVGLFVVGAGIFRTGLAKMISSKILHIGGNNENLLFVLVMLTTALVGAFVSNTGTVAVMLPIIMSMTASSGLNPRRYLMPLAFASGMGMFTLISTPPNLVVQDAIIGAGYKPLGFFAFAPIGLVIVAVGVFVLFFLSKLLIKANVVDSKNKKSAKTIKQLIGEYNIAQKTMQATVPEGSQFVGKSLKELRLGTEYQVVVGRIIRYTNSLLRKTKTIEHAGADTVINAGDKIYLHGSQENIERLAFENGLDLSQTQTAASEVLGYGEVLILPNSHFVNRTIADIHFRELYNVNVIAIKHKGEYDTDNIRDIKLHSGDTLLMQGTWDNIAKMDEYDDNYVLLGSPKEEIAKVTLDRKAPVALTIMVAMIAMLVIDVVPAVAVVLSAALAMVLTGCLRNMEEAYSSINWSSIVLIAAMVPMSIAFTNTGITAAISDFLLNGFGDISPRMLLAVIYFSTSILTLFISNTATAILFAPIAMSAAAGMGVSPYPFLFAVAVAASMCFASPFSTPPNALVMGPGGYTFSDYIRVGLPLQIIMGVVMVLVLPLIYPFAT